MTGRRQTGPTVRSSSKSPEIETLLIPMLRTGLGLVACVAILTASFLGVFRVRHVDVVGNGVPRDVVIQQSGVLGTNVFLVRSDRVATRLAGVPEIVVRRIDTSFPDTVTVYASERTPMVAWRNAGVLYELDPEGNRIRQVRFTRLPIVEGGDIRGGLGPGVVQAVRYAVQVLPNEPSGAIAGFRFGTTTGLTIAGRSGWIATVGSGTPQILVSRISVLAGVLSKAKKHTGKLQQVDLRSAPYVRFGSP